MTCILYLPFYLTVCLYIEVNFDGINKLGADTAKYTRARAKSIADPTKVQLPTISVEESELDSDTQKLKDLYNLAIERVKSVDEAMLAQTGGVPGGKMKVILFIYLFIIRTCMY